MQKHVIELHVDGVTTMETMRDGLRTTSRLLENAGCHVAARALRLAACSVDDARETVEGMAGMLEHLRDVEWSADGDRTAEALKDPGFAVAHGNWLAFASREPAFGSPAAAAELVHRVVARHCGPGHFTVEIHGFDVDIYGAGVLIDEALQNAIIRLEAHVVVGRLPGAALEEVAEAVASWWTAGSPVDCLRPGCHRGGAAAVADG